MLAAIKHGLGSLLNFRGRDARQAFWYYVLFIYLIQMAVTMVAIIPVIFRTIATGVQRGIDASHSGDPAATQAATEAMMMHSMTGMMSTLIVLSSITAMAMLALVAAAFVRRLHDSGLAGWWALLPGAMQVANLFIAPAMMAKVIANMEHIQPGEPAGVMAGAQNTGNLASILGWSATLIVIGLGVRKSTPGPNRYGETSFTA